MKNIILIFISFCLVSACKEEDSKPTTFRGRVVYQDNNQIITGGIIEIYGIEALFANARSLSKDTMIICCEGKFDITLSYHQDVDYYLLNYFYYDANGNLVAPALDCSAISPYRDCMTLKPGKTYEFDLKVMR